MENDYQAENINWEKNSELYPNQSETIIVLNSNKTY